MLRSVFVNAGHVRSGWRFASFAIVVTLLLIAAQRALSYIPATAPLIEHAKAGAISVNALLLLDGMGRRFPYVTDKRESLLPTTLGAASQPKLG
jgi:hypothetical protein